MARQVIVYTQPGWGSCDQEKEFLSRKGVAFTVKNVREDKAAMEELQKMGYRATPVTVIDGEVVVGFDRGRLERLLSLAWSAAVLRPPCHPVDPRGGAMPAAYCKGWGQDIEIPGGIAKGEHFDCPNWAGLSLRVSESAGGPSVTEVRKASCAVGEEVVILPDDVQPGDIIDCHGVRQRVTYEYGAYALVRADWW